MKYLSVTEIAKKWGVSERSVRNYCANGKIEGAFVIGKCWSIPENATKPMRSNAHAANNCLLNVLKREKDCMVSGGIYHRVQIDLTYNSNHIEGSKLTHDQTRYIFETNTIGVAEGNLKVDDIIETANHFRCIDLCIDKANKILSEAFIKQLHGILKGGTSDSRKSWFNVGDYKKLPNEVASKQTALPENVAAEMSKLISWYNSLQTVTLDNIIEFHVRFECIHPFQDGNGRVGRLIMFKECLKNNITPFIIDEYHKFFYYRGLSEWNTQKNYLRDTCLSAQDQFKLFLDYFRIPYND